MSANDSHVETISPWTSLRLPRPIFGVTRLDGVATAARALAAAGLDWEVVKKPLPPRWRMWRQPGLRGEKAPGSEGPKRKQMLVRADWRGEAEGGCLGLVSEDYVPLQNRDAFACLDPLVQGGGARFDSIGKVGQGRTVWLLARLPGAVRVKGEDQLMRYLLIANTHGEPSPGVEVRLVPFRLVCSNMLAATVAVSPGKRLEPVPDVVTRLQRMTQSLSRIEHEFAELESNFKQMAGTLMNSERLLEYLTEVLPEPADDRSSDEYVQVLQLRSQAARLFESGRGNQEPAVRGTLWAAYNGVTELIDHHMPDVSPEQRLERIWFGKGHEIKARAYKVAVMRLGIRPVRPVRTCPATERLPRAEREQRVLAVASGPSIP